MALNADQPDLFDARAAEPSPPSNPILAERFRQVADKLQSQIDDKFRDRQTNTPKRMVEAARARNQGVHLERTQAALLALAALHDSGECPDVLFSVTTKKQVHELCTCRYEGGVGYYEAPIDTGEPRKDAGPESLSLWELLKPRSQADKDAETLKRKLAELQQSNIPGYFSTPEPVAALVVGLADIRPGHSVLEPSAGSGALLDAMPGDVVYSCFECNYSLCEVLELKGHSVQRGDFLQADGIGPFDRVIMNPPFEKLQDIDHVRHAFAMLKPGGRLVSVMSPGAFFRTNAKCADFQQWVEELGGEVQDLADESFKSSGTGVATKLLILDRYDDEGE